MISCKQAALETAAPVAALVSPAPLALLAQLATPDHLASPSSAARQVLCFT